MIFNKTITLKNGQEALLRNGDIDDGQEVYDVFNVCHKESDYLLSYPEENSYTPELEANFLHMKTESPDEIELVAVINNKIVGVAGIEAVGHKYKVKHRAEFGISVLKEYCGLGIGEALSKACIECAKEAGYAQLELNVVKDNIPAINLYKKLGFKEYGRNPKGFNSKLSGYQELVYMYLEL